MVYLLFLAVVIFDVGISQLIGWEGCAFWASQEIDSKAGLWSDLRCIRRDVKLYSTQHSFS